MRVIKTISNLFLIIASILSLPIQFIGGIAGIVSVIWLIFLGKWSLIIIGIIFAALMPFALSLITLPTVPLVIAAARLRENNNMFFFTILSFLTSLFINACLGIWTYYTFLFVSEPILIQHPIPALGWSFFALSIPVSSLVSRSEANDSVVFTGIITTACFLALSIMFMNNSFNLGFYILIVLITSFFQSLNIITQEEHLSTNQPTEGY